MQFFFFVAILALLAGQGGRLLFRKGEGTYELRQYSGLMLMSAENSGISRPSKSLTFLQGS